MPSYACTPVRYRTNIPIDALTIVTTEEPTALTDAYALAKLAKREGFAAAPYIVVNMAENRMKGRRVFEQFAAACEQYLGYRQKLAEALCRGIEAYAEALGGIKTARNLP